MKNINIYIIFALVALMASSCMDDLSTIAEFRYPDLIVLEAPPETGVFKELFTYEPKFSIVEGEDTSFVAESLYDDYSYEWRILVEAGRYDTVSTVIGTERLLSITLEALPASSAYTIVLRVTHKEVGFIQTFDWEVDVLSALGQGLLIADTEDGGVSSDISLLMTKVYNASFYETDEDIIHRNIMTAVNGQKLNGLVSNLSFCNSSNNKVLSALVKGESLYGLASITLQSVGENTDFFYFAPPVFSPQSVYNYYGAYSYVTNINGVVHVQSSAAGAQYSFIDEATYPYEINNGLIISRWNSLSYFGGPFLGHDEKNNQFVFISTTGVVKELTAPQEGDNWAFNPRELPEGIEFITAGKRDNYTALALMKSTTNEFSIYRLATSSSRIISGDYIFDLSNCPGLDRATAFAFSEKNDEFYYAVDNELYVVILNVKAPGATVVYSLPEGENISHLKIHLKNSGMTTWSEIENEEGEMVPEWNSSISNVISVASYNGTEGFIRTLPIQYGGAGGIADEKYVHTYGGFGKITAIELRY